MSKFTIEKGVPVEGRATEYKYPIDELEVGDSFMVPWSSGSHGSVRGYASIRNKLTEKKFTCKLVDEGLRVWRIK